MAKAKHWLVVVVVTLALVAPPVAAAESTTVGGWLEAIVAQVLAVLGNPSPPPGDSVLDSTEPGTEPEIGIHVPVGG